MDGDDSLSGLQALHSDLTAVIHLKLNVVDRLRANLELRLEDLQKLLDKKAKNDASRTALGAGKIAIGDNEYEVNGEFAQQALQLADGLDLDELDAAALFLGAQQESQELDRSQAHTAVLRFHRRREYVLLCLRELFRAALDGGDGELDCHDLLLQATQIIVGVDGVNFGGAHQFCARCLAGMGAIERWLHDIAERLESAQVVGQAPDQAFVELMGHQRASLVRQHEYLAAICTHMVKVGFASLDNYHALLARLQTLDRHDLLTVHYVPMVLRLTAWVALESSTTTKDARALHDKLMAGRESDNWPLRNLHAATLAWWLAEYSGRYVDPNAQDPDLRGVNLEDEATARSEAFLRTLNDGAFHFMLSVAQDVRPTKWHDPTKTSMITSLLQDAATLPSDSAQPDDFFAGLVVDQLQTFVDSFITNMPDTLRRLKAEEDDQRRRLHMSFQRTAADHPMHLERFLLVVSYAYDGSPEAAEEFWNDKESNLYGFLQWAAKRQPTPRIAMFCEMLRSISTGEANAESAHQFLGGGRGPTSGQIRRTSSLSYDTIFSELVEFQKNIHEPKKAIQGGLYPQSNPADQIVEPESATMLESYLRLLAHVCKESTAARSWMFENDFNLVGVCFGLCADKVDSALRATAYEVLSGLLVHKTVHGASAVWTSLDDWTVSGFYVDAKPSNTLGPVPTDEFWTTLGIGYDESLAFTRLLQTLVGPYEDGSELNDTLPFPESLGSMRRMPGIQKYIDFVMSRVFAEHSPEVRDAVQRNVMRSTCLRFIVTCLQTFNEDLVVLANKSSINVDAVMDASSLEAYVTLHPFTRVMEWLFNDKVLKALFASSHHDVAEVDSAPSDSPLVQSLMLSIEVMDLVMRLQSTYLDIVRPIIKQQSSFGNAQVSNISLASFEDAILSNLQLIVDLGLYCGTGHQELTIASLHLLEKLASSRKLAVSPAGFGQRSGRSKIVGILEKDNEAERIGRSLANLMQYSDEEFEVGPEAPGYIVKLRILEFLKSCLAAVSTRPTIAHVLLGFSCLGNTVHIDDDSLWANGQSLFHAILLLAVGYPDVDPTAGTFVSWQSNIKTSCWDVLQKLWSSPLTSAIVMQTLDDNDLIFIQAPKLIAIDENTAWDGLSLAQGIAREEQTGVSDFFSGSPAVALQNFLRHRAAYLDYEARQLRLAVKEGMPSLKSRIQSVMMGITLQPGEDAVRNPSIFDLFDFIDLHIPERDLPLQHALLEGIDINRCQEDKQGVTVYSLPLLEQFFLLKIKQWKMDGIFENEEPSTAVALVSQPQQPLGPEQIRQRAAKNEADVLFQAQGILAIFADFNRRAELVRVHKEILRSWVQLLTIALQGCDFEANTKASFILQTLQVILPKLEVSYNNDIFTALQLASLAEALIQNTDFSATTSEISISDFSNDRLSQLFRAALIGISCPVTTTELREYCYQIAFRYIHGTIAKASKGSPLGRHTLNTVKNCGSHLLEVVCDDAYSGQGTCKVSALLLLTALVAVSSKQESKYILETFAALNFIGVLVDNIKHIPEELKAASAAQVPVLLSYYDSSLALLLRICQTRIGAAYVLNAGLFQSIKESSIFLIDPDIGLEFDNPNALKEYYELLLSVLRVINAAVISRGAQNDQTKFQAREFLKENRRAMVAIFKRSVNVGVGRDADEDLSDLVDCFTVLVEHTDFLKYEDSSTVKKTRSNMFS